MANQTLAVKYRPSSFDDVVEQESIKLILCQQISSNTFKQAYLFCGPAGCGKTTAARIFAKDINKGEGNALEVDAASNNGVDNIREIIDNAKRRSLDSEYKVYIIDEVHMLSIGAFNAMLKLIEEPPKNSVFIMCTTDPQKIPATILSRVQRYDFSKISHARIVERLALICRAENDDTQEAWAGRAKESGQALIEYDEDALEYIAKLADGGMRDAITMLDKCISYSPAVTLENAVRALGTVNYVTHFDLLYALATGGATQAVELIDTTYNDGKDMKQFIKQFQYFMVDVCKYHLFRSFRYVSIPNVDNFQQRLEDEDMQTCVTILEWVRQLNADIKWESNPKAIIETSAILFCRREQS